MCIKCISTRIHLEKGSQISALVYIKNEVSQQGRWNVLQIELKYFNTAKCPRPPKNMSHKNQPAVPYMDPKCPRKSGECPAKWEKCPGKSEKCPRFWENVPRLRKMSQFGTKKGKTVPFWDGGMALALALISPCPSPRARARANYEWQLPLGDNFLTPKGQ